jgi:excisionase family DNA binding protein
MKSLDQLLTVEDLANYLDVPVATIYSWRYRHQGPPGFRVGRHLRFRWSDVERWIEDRIAQTCHSSIAQSQQVPTVGRLEEVSSGVG